MTDTPGTPDAPGTPPDRPSSPRPAEEPPRRPVTPPDAPDAPPPPNPERPAEEPPHQPVTPPDAPDAPPPSNPERPPEEPPRRPVTPPDAPDGPPVEPERPDTRPEAPSASARSLESDPGPRRLDARQPSDEDLSARDPRGDAADTARSGAAEGGTIDQGDPKPEGQAAPATVGETAEDRWKAMRRPEPPRRTPKAPEASDGETGGDAAASKGAPGPDDLERPGGLLSRIDHHVVLYHDAHGLQAEQYRQCRTNLTALNRSGAPFVVVVTSSRKGEGKSVSAANLAVCLAEMPGARVCLLDADSRGPSQGSLLGVQSSAGLTQLLAGRAALKDVLVQTLIPGLQVIPAGGEMGNPAEALGGPRFAELMAELRRRFSWIIVDTPPVHPFTDACVAARSANGVLVVVRLLETPRHLVNNAVEAVRNAGGTVLGTFLTGMTPDRDDEEDVSFYPADAGAESPDGIKGARKAKRKQEKVLLRQERSILKQQGRAEKDDDPFPV